MRIRNLSSAALVLLAAVIVVGGCKKSEPEPGETAGDIASSVGKAVESIEQTICPVMGGKIDKNCHTEYKGKKVYFCCPACIEKFKAEPEKYLEKLPQFK